MKGLKLTKITLTTKDGKQVELSLEEAKELHGQLDELFGVKFVPHAPIIIERPYPYWKRWDPIWISDTTSWPRYEVTCKSLGMTVAYSGEPVS